MPPRDKISNYTTYGIYRQAATTTAFSGRYYDFVDDITNREFVSIAILIVNDSSNNIQFSFDGTNVHGDIKGGETLSFDRRREQEIWLRSAAGSDDFRVWAW